MPRHTLTEEQRLLLLEWLAADFPSYGIQRQFAERGWPKISDQLLSYYRKTYAPEIAQCRAARLDSALTRGLARKEARVAALVANAEALESIKWVADPKTGRLHNEKAYRETLADIAAEMGERPQRTELSGRDGGPLQIQQFTADDLAAARQRALEYEQGLSAGDSQ